MSGIVQLPPGTSIRAYIEGSTTEQLSSVVTLLRPATVRLLDDVAQTYGVVPVAGPAGEVLLDFAVSRDAVVQDMKAYGTPYNLLGGLTIRIPAGAQAKVLNADGEPTWESVVRAAPLRSTIYRMPTLPVIPPVAESPTVPGESEVPSDVFKEGPATTRSVRWWWLLLAGGGGVVVGGLIGYSMGKRR